MEEYDLSSPHQGTLAQIVACPGRDYCDLAKAVSIPIATRVQERFNEMNKLLDIGDLNINISGCENSCAHHHIADIGLLGMQKNGEEYYQITLAGETLYETNIGKKLGPSVSYEAVVDAVENIVNVARLAKDVMEKTPHVMLAGKGAEDFAISEGYKQTDLLTEKSKEDWKKWLESEEYRPIINIENHDTIGMLCLDKNNNISGACTTSGLAYKMKGRVGDSPIIGSGLFIDNKIGGAVATGLGEEVVKTVGSFLVVELMRQGKSPQEACETAVKRIVSSNSQENKFQVAYIAMNKNGEVGSYSIEPGFTYMDYFRGENKEKITESAF